MNRGEATRTAITNCWLKRKIRFAAILAMGGAVIAAVFLIRPEWLSGKKAIGVTAGASAPEILVQQVVERLRELGGTVATELPGRSEHVVFALPAALRGGPASREKAG